MCKSKSLNSILYQIVVEAPNSAFLVESHESALTYVQAYRIVSSLLPTRLCSICPQLSSTTIPQRKVTLISHNNSLFPLVLWACWQLSVEVVMLSINMDPFLWKGALDINDPQLVIVSEDAHAALSKHLRNDFRGLQVVTMDDLIPPQYRLRASALRKSDYIPSLLRWLADAPSDARPNAPNLILSVDLSPELPAVSLFTSSAVDVQSLKCITYTHSMLVRSGERTMDMMGGSAYWSRPVRHLGWLPLSHCFEFCISLIGTVLRSGGTYIFFDSQVSSPDVRLSTPAAILLLQAIQYHQPVDATCTVPAIMEDLMKSCSPCDLGNLRTMRSLGVGGAKTSETTFEWAMEHGIPYVDISGATEAVGAICSRRSLKSKAAGLGLQMAPGLEGLLEKETVDDTHGELVIRATQFPRNYTNIRSTAYSYDEELGITTYRTGDIYEQKCIQPSSCYVKGEIVPRYPASEEPLSGLAYIGRIDDIIVLTLGVKINALDLERSYDMHPGIERTAVICNLDGTTPVLLVQPVLQGGGSGLTHEQSTGITDYILRHNETLPYEKRVQTENILFVEKLPLTPKLTLNRKQIKKTWLESRGKWPGELNQFSAHISDAFGENKSETRRRVTALLVDIFDIPNENLEDDAMNFSSFAMTSSVAVTTLAKALESHFNVQIRAHQIYDLRSVDDICRLIDAANYVKHTGRATSSSSGKSEESARTLASRGSQQLGEDLVITGLACCLPGGIRSLDAFWSALLKPDMYEARASREPPSPRWSSSSVDEKDLPPVLWLEDDVLDNVDTLADFFHLPPREAASLSPNARLVLQLGYQALEDSAIAPRSLAGKSWGVYTSVNDSGWRERMATEANPYELAEGFIGSADSAVGGRLSYFLDLTGPAVEIKTACSSSAVAIHHACMAIRNGDCEAAIVVSATTHFDPSGLLFRAKAGIVSMTGQCAPFTSEADGFIPSEGATAIIIQKAADAVCEPYGVIKASRVMQDGRSHGFFAPNPSAQSQLLRETFKAAGCPASEVDYIECHGTGTRIGDAIEIQAISNFLGESRKRPLLVGSVKAVFGHNEECAGMTGLIKSLLCLRENAIPPQPEFRFLNPDIDFGSSKILVPRRIQALIGRHKLRRLGISSFGISGTLCHILIEEFNATSPSYHHTSSPLLFLLSANSLSEYKHLLKQYSEYALSVSALEVDIRMICRTTQLGRDHFSYRRAYAIEDHHSLFLSLSKELSDPKPRIRNSKVKIGLWFSLPITPNVSLELDDVYYQTLQSSEVRNTWAKSYTFFQQQLSVAYVLRSLGCQITAVGGEGIAELVAAVFARILPYESEFQSEQQEYSDHRVFSTLIQRERLNDLLCQYAPPDVTLRGHHGGDLFTLQVSSEEIVRQLQQSLNLNLHRQTILESFPYQPGLQGNITASIGVQFFSGYLGEALDPTTMSSTSYWTAVSTRFVDSPKAWNTMKESCDLIVGIGSRSEIQSHLGNDGVCFNRGNDFIRLLGILYEKGCDLDWTKFGKGRRSHLPQYCWG